VEINKSLLESHLRRARVMTDDINPAVKLSFEGSQARVEAESAGLGSARTSFDVDLQGPGGYIVFNPNFLLDALKVAETDSVRFQFEDASTPGKFTLGEQFVYVVMPITTS
jgi:DNA polymerase-3 subunit beta